MATVWLCFVSALYLVASVAAVSVANGTTARYDPAELLAKIFRTKITLESRQRGHGLVRFEGQPDTDILDNEDIGQYRLLDIERDQTPLRFEDDYELNYNTNIDNNNQNKPVKFEDSDDYLNSHSSGVTFQDDNNVNDEGTIKKRKRKRRRKPKNGVLSYQGRPGIDAGRPEAVGFQVPFQTGYGVPAHGTPGYTGVRPFRRPRRARPRPSLATEALSSITGALTSIALYDDSQCVPRLLCEAAGGGGLPGQGVLQGIAGIQPLLTLLSAYNGISSSPLFVFGRAVFLGMTSPGSPAPCRYAYPLCPTDPEQLIYYLNNHNGGFFRFFNAPQQPNQNLEQFYNQLGNQGYGLYHPPNPAYGYPNDQNSGQHYGFHSSNQNPGQYYGQNDGFQGLSPYEKPSLYNNQNYGANYAYDYGNYGSENQIRFRDVQIQKRIQNKPTQNLADHEDKNFQDYDVKTNWQFPADPIENINNYNARDSRTLKFPDESQSNNDEKEFTRKGKQVYFSNKNYDQNYYATQQHVIPNGNRFQTSTYSYNNGQNQQNYYTNRPITNTYNNNYKDPPKYHHYDYKPSNYKENAYQKYQNYQNPGTSNNAYKYQQNYYNRQNIHGNNQKYQPNTVFKNEEYVFDRKHNFYVKKENNYSNSADKYNTNNYSNVGNNYYNANNNFERHEDDGVKTVYVVRGNGDPNTPEIVKLRPGQSVY